MRTIKINNWVLSSFYCLVAVAVLTQTSAGNAQSRQMTFGVISPTTAYHAVDVATVKLIGKEIPEVNFTTTEVGGYDSVLRLMAREIELAPCLTNAIIHAWQGIKPFKEPFKGLRVLWYHDFTPLNFIARADTEIKNFKDLEGKKFGPVARGYSTEKVADAMVEILGVKPKFYRGDGGDIKNAMLNREIDALVKAGRTGEPFIVEIQTALPIVFIEISDADIKKVVQKLPYMVPFSQPLDKFGMAGKVHKTLMFMRGSVASSRLSQEFAYRMTKGVLGEAGQKELKKSYPPAADLDLIKFTIDAASQAPDHPPLHAGVVQYFLEKGYQVPSKLIPSEYKK